MTYKITDDFIKFGIGANKCTECGNCANTCPNEAIIED